MLSAEGRGGSLALQPVQMLPGKGVSAAVNGHMVLAGNQKMLGESGIVLMPEAEAERYLRQGSTLTYVAVDDVPAGYIVLSELIFFTNKISFLKYAIISLTT